VCCACPVIYHDFNAGTPTDFEVGCTGMTGGLAATTGMVQPTLNAQGLPALATSPPSITTTCVTSAATFGEWYTDGKDSNTIIDSIVLFDDTKGGFVNRFGANGEQWQGFQAIASVPRAMLNEMSVSQTT